MKAGHLRLHSFIALALGFFSATEARADFDFRKSITIDSTKVSATLTNFPLLVSLTDNDLRHTGSGGDVTSSNGYDILFRATDATTCGGTAPCTLDHEIEKYVSSTGQLIAWVRVPSISSTTDTVIYMYYGYSDITSSIEDVEGVWDSDFVLVQHMHENARDSSPQFTDSTANSYDGTFSGGEIVIESRVASTNDDAEEDTSGNIDLSSSDLELADEDTTQEIGMRFTSLAIPQGAKITNAFVEFEVDETDSSTTNLTFYAQDTDDASAFSTTNSDISSRTKTSASVSWSSLDAWDTLDVRHRTPDLSSIIQEVVDRSGWSSGNDLAVIVTGSGTRTAESYDGESANAPLLHVEYAIEVRVNSSSDDAEEDTSGNIDLSSSDLELVEESTVQQVGMRFTNVSLPQGTSISNAYIEFEVDETSSGATSVTLYCEDTDDAGTFTSSNGDISGRTKTSASVAWSSIAAWNTESEKKQTPDLSSIIQEVVDRSGWSSGNDLAVIVTGSGSRIAESYNGESSNAPLLHVEHISGSASTAKIGDGHDFDGGDDYIQTSSNELKTANNFTISMWFKTDSTSFGSHLVWQGESTANGWGWAGNPEQELNLSIGGFPAEGTTSADHIVSFHVGDTDATDNTDVLDIEAALTDTSSYHHVVVTVSSLDTSPSTELFLDGTSAGTDTGTTTRTSRTSFDTNLRIGRPGADQRYFNGMIDEVRISTVVRSDAWISAEYANQNSPGTFYTVGSEESDPLTAITLSHFEAIATDEGNHISWTTETELSTLGYYLHKETGEVLTQLTQEPIPAMGIGNVGPQSYEWFDASGGPGELYWLEELTFDGQGHWHGPVEAER